MLGHSALSETPLSSLPVVVSGEVLTLTGVTRNRCGDPEPGCSVVLFRSSDNIPVSSTVSNGAGVYTFTNPAGGPFWAASYSADGSLGGVTGRNLTPT